MSPRQRSLSALGKLLCSDGNQFSVAWDRSGCGLIAHKKERILWSYRPGLFSCDGNYMGVYISQNPSNYKGAFFIHCKLYLDET